MSRMITILLAPVLISGILISGSALAAQTQMICKNPRRSYLVTFDDVTKTLRVGAAGPDTFYQVKRVENGANGQVVHGKTVKGGPNFVAHLGGKKRMELVDSGQIVQTDPCE